MMIDRDPSVEFRADLDPAGMAAGPPCPLCGRALRSALLRRLDVDVPRDDEHLRLSYGRDDTLRRLELDTCGCRVLLGGTTIPEVEVHKDTGHLHAVRLYTREPEGEAHIYFRVLHAPDDMSDRTRIQVEGVTRTALGITGFEAGATYQVGWQVNGDSADMVEGGE